MKKLLFMCAILFFTASGSYAFQQGIYATNNYAGANVGINMNCSYVKLDLYWSTSSGGNGGGSGVAYSDDGTLIGEHYYTEGWSASTYTAGIFSYRYWGNVQMYLQATNCSGTAILEWVP